MSFQVPAKLSVKDAVLEFPGAANNLEFKRHLQNVLTAKCRMTHDFGSCSILYPVFVFAFGGRCMCLWLSAVYRCLYVSVRAGA
jgi:hypothetical protein